MKADSRSLALILAGTLLALASPALAREPYTERSELTIPAAGIRVLELDNARGVIQVRRSPDGQLHLNAYKICRAETAQKARDLARQTTVQTGREGDRYALRVQYPKHMRVQLDFWQMLKSDNWNHGLMPRVEVRLVADCPDGVVLRLRTVSGDISTEGIVAGQTIEATSGDVVVKGAHALGISTVSGDVVVTQATDSVRIESASGDVLIEDAPKGVTIRTVSGDVRVKGVAAAAQLSSVSGDIRVRLRGPLQRGHIESTSGELWIDLAGGMDAALDIASASGSIDCRVPLTLEHAGRQSLTGRYGRGGAPIQIRSASGDITVTSGGR